jgi:hypothetical protein
MTSMLSERKLLLSILQRMESRFNNVILVICLLLLGCGENSNTNLETGHVKIKKMTADSLFALNLIKEGDSLIKNINRKDIEIYVQNQKGIVKVINENWPENIEKTINLIKKDLKPIIYIEIPYSESGDWNNIYKYYFDKNGNTRAIKVTSSFFNSQCISGALTEETEYLFDDSFKAITTIYNIHDDNGNIVRDTSKCTFNYRFDFPKYIKLSQIPLFSSMQE